MVDPRCPGNGLHSLGHPLDRHEGYLAVLVKHSQSLGIQQETTTEREQALRGPGPRTKKNRLYPSISWANEYEEEADVDSEPPHKKTVIGIPLKDVSQLI